MLYTLSNPYSLCLGLILILLLIAGLATLADLTSIIFQRSATSVSNQLMMGLYHFVQLAAIVYCAIVILALLTGGGINAL